MCGTRAQFELVEVDTFAAVSPRRRGYPKLAPSAGEGWAIVESDGVLIDVCPKCRAGEAVA